LQLAKESLSAAQHLGESASQHVEIDFFETALEDLFFPDFIQLYQVGG